MKTGILLISILLLVFITPNSFAGNYDRTFSSQVQFGLVSHKLYVSVPSSLCGYYNGKTHSIKDDSDYATFVTPDAFQSIAENIWNLTRDKPRSDEEFANTVLQLIHQIPYANGDLKYPVETLVDNSGKCDTLSLLAASIMKAGGLDVILLYHKEVHHINVGVYLPYEPHCSWWWLTPTGYEFNGKKYWIAECTSATDWKVGDLPPLLADTKPWIISLENSEESSPAQIAAKLDSPLNQSSISINLSSDPSDITSQDWNLTISGSISPAYPNESVTVYFSQDLISYNTFKTETDDMGNYSFSWNLTSPGTYYIKTSWSGTSDYSGADSEIFTVFVGFPQSLIQFRIPPYYYTSSPAFAVAHELRVIQGVEDFLDLNLSGTGVVLTGDFIILKDKQNTSSIQTKTITIPEMELTFRIGRQRSIMRIPATTTKVPMIPEDMRAIRLPDNAEQTTNNKFSIILRNSGGNNYSVAVRGMNDYNMLQINQPNEMGIVFMNASTSIREDIWYRVVARISEDEITAELLDVNGSLLESATATDDATRTNKLVMLMANNKDSAIAFKNLKVETLEKPVKTLPKDNLKAANENELLVVYYIAVTILLATTFAAVVYKKRKSSRTLTSVLTLEHLKTVL